MASVDPGEHSEAAGRPARRRGRPSNTAEASERRRQELVEAAYEVFADLGYYNGGIADITARLNIGHGTFYRYFDNKRDILDHVFDYCASRLLDQIMPRNHRDATTLDELREQLTAVCLRVFGELIDRDPRLPRVVLLEISAIDAELLQRVLGLLETVTALLTPMIANGVRRGFLPEGLDVQSSARALTGCVLSGLFTTVRTPMSAAERQRYISTVVSLICDNAPQPGAGAD